MTPKKAARKAAHQRQTSHLNPISDYDTDTAAFTDTGLLQDPPPPTRTNEELNLAVLKRHNPEVTSIVSIAPYAVIYKFSASSSTWEKRGVEGTLFVVSLIPERISLAHPSNPEDGDILIPRFGVIVLNRRGLDNFSTELKSGDDVEITEEYVILQVRNDTAEEQENEFTPQEYVPDIIGLWIFSEPPPSSTAQTRILTAQIIQECANQTEASRQAAKEAVEEAERAYLEASEQALYENGTAPVPPDGAQPKEHAVDGNSQAIPMGRQLSLRQLFGQQRQDDDAWSVRGHNSPPMQRAQLVPHQVPNLDEHVASTSQSHIPNLPQTQQPQLNQIPSMLPNRSQQDLLLSLFKNAKDAKI
ncbi:MAG: hypothetical protein M1820_009218 [Bogoriella megaspora]|nr:MAG: hypothetical protein M1820_009218 [Bogoriella megaspora]